VVEIAKRKTGRQRLMGDDWIKIVKGQEKKTARYLQKARISAEQKKKEEKRAVSAPEDVQ